MKSKKQNKYRMNDNLIMRNDCIVLPCVETITRLIDEYNSIQIENEKKQQKLDTINEKCKLRPLDDFYLVPIISVGDILDIINED